MGIQVSCPYCNYYFEVDGKHAGHNVKCPTCSGNVNVPSGLDFDTGSTTTNNCPICGCTISMEEEMCQQCGSNVKSNVQVKVDQLPDVYKRPTGMKKTKFSLLPVIIVLFSISALAGGVFYYSGKKKQSLSVEKLLPANTKIIMVIDNQKLQTFTSENESTAKAFFQKISDKISQQTSLLIPGKLKIKYPDDIDSFYIVGQNWKFFSPIFGEGKDFQGFLILKGNFDENNFDEFAEQTDRNSGLEDNYLGYTIIKSRRSLPGQNRMFYYTLFHHQILVLSPDVEQIRNLIQIKNGEGSISEVAAKWCETNSCIQLSGTFDKEFFKGNDWSSQTLTFLSKLEITFDYKEQQVDLHIKKEYSQQVEKGKQLLSSWKRRCLQYLPEVASKNHSALTTALGNLTIAQNKNSLSLQWKGDSSIINAMDWMFIEGGITQLELHRQWNSIKNLSNDDIEASIKELDKFLRYMQSKNLSQTPLFTKVLEQKQSWQQSLQTKQFEGAAQAKLEKIMSTVDSNDLLKSWSALQRFYTIKHFQKTRTFQEAKQQQKNLENRLVKKISKKIEQLEELKRSGDYFRYQEIMANYKLDYDGVDKVHMQAIAIGNAELKKLFDQYRKLVQESEIQKEKYTQKVEENFQKLSKESTQFLDKKLPTLLKVRKFKDAENRLLQLTKEFEKLGKENSEPAKQIKQKSKETKKLSKFFTLTRYELSQLKKKRKITTFTMVKGARKVLRGKVIQIARTGFVLQDSKKKKYKIRYSDLTASSIEKLISQKKYTPEACYYLGLLFYCEQKPKWAKKYLNLAKDIESAEKLLKKMEK